jgi:transposase, IS5 family
LRIVIKIASDENLPQRQTYKRVSKQLFRDTYNGNHPKRAKKAKVSMRKLKTIAKRLLRELERTMSEEHKRKYQERLQILNKVMTQQRKDKNKIYSIHKPYTDCIAKGKAHIKYEFGNKIGLNIDAKNLIIQSILAFRGNPHDSKTIEPLIKQSLKLNGYIPNEIVYDRGGRGSKEIMGSKISTPSKTLKKDSEYEKRKKRRKFRRRAAIEPVIGHLKTDHRMHQCYLHGEKSAQINALLAAAGWNFKKRMEKLIKAFLFLFFQLKKIFNSKFDSIFYNHQYLFFNEKLSY